MQAEDNTDEIGTLISKVAAADAAAFRLLWDRLAGRLTAFGTRYLGSHEDGQDLTQETFLKIHRRASQFDPTKGTGTAWVFTIARNVARDRLRQQRLRWIVGLDDLPFAVTAPAAGPEQQAVDRDTLAASHSAILDLPDAQRMALLLATIGDVQTTEIARIMGKSRGSVEQLIVRARKRLRAMTKENNDVGT
ncbi:MAG: RNA polymerase sigma factor [Pseudomonadota bacterium]